MSIEMNGGEANNILETINIICTKQYVSYDKMFCDLLHMAGGFVFE